jgi:hypothetical protein
MKTSKFFLLLIPALLWLSTACKPDNPLDPNDTTDGTKTAVSSQIKMSAKVDGADFQAEYVTAVQTHVRLTDVYQYTIKGETDAGEEIQFVIQRIGEKIVPGTYEVEITNAEGIIYLTNYKPAGEQSFYNPATGNIGQIKIDKATSSETSGSFNFQVIRGSSESKTITEGTFTSNNYAERDL